VIESHPGAGSPEAIVGLGVAAITLLCMGLVMFVFSMLADCQERRFPQRRLRRNWTLVILLLPVIGAAVYYYFGRPQGEKPPPAFPRYY